MGLVSKNCVDFVKGFEGFSATPYYDEVGVKTLGYGMTGSEISGISYVTEAQAASMLENLLNNNYASVIKADLDNKGVSLSQNEFDALVSMAYNIGTVGLLGSTLYRQVCAGIRNEATITNDFCMWDKAGGRVLEGLLRRRRGEAAMFFGHSNLADAGGGDSNSESDTVKQIQSDLNRLGVKDNSGKKLDEDGISGTSTKGAISNFQYIMGLSTDGIYGNNTCAAMTEVFSKPLCGVPYVHRYATRYIQWYLGTDIDGIFGSGTEGVVKAWQTKVGLEADGLFGPQSWSKVIK